MAKGQGIGIVCIWMLKPCFAAQEAVPPAEVLLVRVKVDPEARAAAREEERALLELHRGSRKQARAAAAALKQEELN